MKYIRGIPTQDEFIRLYNSIELNLTQSLDINPSIYTNSYILASSIFDRCIDLFPHHLIRVLQKKGKLVDFKKELVRHVVFNTRANEYLDNVQIVRNHQYTASTRNSLINITKSGNNEDFNDEFSSVTSNYSRNLRNHIGGHLHLSENEIANRTTYAVPAPIAPFVFYLTVNYKEHKNFQFTVDSKEDYKRLDKYISLFKEFVTNQTNEEDQKLLNLYLFEREYNIYLSNTITSLAESSFIDYDNAIKVLCLTSLLPNIFGRAKLVNLLVDSVQDMAVGGREEGYVDYVSSYISKRLHEAFWFERTPEIIIQLAYFTIPMLELLHGYLYNAVPIYRPANHRSLNLFPSVEDIQSFISINKKVKYSKFNKIKKHVNTISENASSIPINHHIEKLSLWPPKSNKSDRFENFTDEIVNTRRSISRSVFELTNKFMEILDIPK